MLSPPMHLIESWQWRVQHMGTGLVISRIPQDISQSVGVPEDFLISTFDTSDMV